MGGGIMADPASAIGNGVDWKTVALAACSIATTLLAMFVSAIRSEQQRQSEKLAEIDKVYVNKEELKTLEDEIDDRIESRHQENQRTLERISNKIDVNEEKEAKTRHDIRDAVNALVIQQSVFQEKIELWRRENERAVTAAAAAASAAAAAAAAAASVKTK
jgi:uncharacterized membrane protein YhiD involved in acid resistance